MMLNSILPIMLPSTLQKISAMIQINNGRSKQRTDKRLPSKKGWEEDDDTAQQVKTIGTQDRIPSGEQWRYCCNIFCIPWAVVLCNVTVFVEVTVRSLESKFTILIMNFEETFYFFCNDYYKCLESGILNTVLQILFN